MKMRCGWESMTARVSSLSGASGAVPRKAQVPRPREGRNAQSHNSAHSLAITGTAKTLVDGEQAILSFDPKVIAGYDDMSR